MAESLLMTFSDVAYGGLTMLASNEVFEREVDCRGRWEVE